MATKSITIRISEELFNSLSEDNRNQDIVSQLESLKTIREVSLLELRGLFSQNEWSFLAETLNGTLTDGIFRCNAGVLVAVCEDAIRFEFNQFNIDLDEISRKIKTLRGANIDAIYTRIESFWNNPNRNLDELSIF